MPRNVILLIAAISVIGANAFALSPIALAVAASFPGVAGTEVMTASAAYGLATAASAAWLAPQADRIGAARMLRLALTGLAGALGLSALAPTLWALCAAQALAGLAAGAAIPATYARAAEIAPEGRAAQTTGAVLFGWTISMAAGVTLSALVADLAHWRALYLGLGLSTALLALGLRAAPHEATTPAPGADMPRATAWSVVRSTPSALTLLGVAGAFMTAFYGVYSFLGAHLTGALGVSTALAGLSGLAYGAGFGAAALLDGALDRIGARRALPLGAAACCLVYAALALSAPRPLLLAAAIMLWGFVNHATLTALLNRLSALAPAHRGALLGLNSAVTYLAVFAGAAGFRPLFEHAGFAACALAACALTAVAALLSVMSLREGNALTGSKTLLSRDAPAG